MRPVRRKRLIGRGERRLDEGTIGAGDEADDRRAVWARVGGVGDVADLLSRRDRRHRGKLPSGASLAPAAVGAAAIQIGYSSPRFSRSARFKSLSQGPTGAPASASRFFQTLT